MSERITRPQAEALAAFITRIREDWHHPGVVAAIRAAADVGSPAAIGGALCRLAENRELTSPALLSQPGPHWGATTAAARKPPTPCPDHPGQRAMHCTACPTASDPPSPEYEAAKRALATRARRRDRGNYVPQEHR